MSDNIRHISGKSEPNIGQRNKFNGSDLYDMRCNMSKLFGGTFRTLFMISIGFAVACGGGGENSRSTSGSSRGGGSHEDSVVYREIPEGVFSLCRFEHTDIRPNAASRHGIDTLDPRKAIAVVEVFADPKLKNEFKVIEVLDSWANQSPLEGLIKPLKGKSYSLTDQENDFKVNYDQNSQTLKITFNKTGLGSAQFMFEARKKNGFPVCDNLKIDL